MEILNELKRKNSEYLLGVIVGKYVLSIQASDLHYSIPRKKLDNLNDYSKFELAIINEKGFLNIGKSSVFRKFPKYAELKMYRSGKDYIFAFVPIELINELYLYLKNK